MASEGGLLNILAIVQFLWLLFAPERSQLLAGIGNTLAICFANVGRFLACAMDEKPLPWRTWHNAGAPRFRAPQHATEENVSDSVAAKWVPGPPLRVGCPRFLT